MYAGSHLCKKSVDRLNGPTEPNRPFFVKGRFGSVGPSNKLGSVANATQPNSIGSVGRSVKNRPNRPMNTPMSDQHSCVRTVSLLRGCLVEGIRIQ